MAGNTPKMTPMMKQYWEIKSRYPDKDTILFFRLGDFYEMFFDDAEVAAKILDIALTSRNKSSDNPVPLCGIPFHSADGYISKLLAGGKKVAICEQVEDPAKAKGIVKRDVIRVITPGTITELENLESGKHNYLASIQLLGNKWGFALIDVTTGLFKAAEFGSLKELVDELSRIEPSELLLGRSTAEIFKPEEYRRCSPGTVFTLLDDPAFDPNFVLNILADKDIKKLPDSAKGAAGAVCHYVEYTAKEVVSHIKGIELYESRQSMIINESTKRNLELTKTMIDSSRYGSLLWLLDKTVTPMGSRTIREWLIRPLISCKEITARQDAVETLLSDNISSEKLGDILSHVSDLERISGRIAMETANARELVALDASLRSLAEILDLKKDFHNKKSGLLKEILDNIDVLNDVVKLIESSIAEEPPLSLREGKIIKKGFSSELDELRDISVEGKGFIAKLEAKERERTGISSMKIKYNRVFGYYIEVTNTHKDKVPEDYIRKQTLANAERYITPDLKSFEEKVLGAEERIKALEYELFAGIRYKLTSYVNRIKQTSNAIAKLDSLLSFAIVARENRYVRPEINDSSEIFIKEGRHPIIEKLNSNDHFVPNDVLLNNSSDRLLIITGPNMAGKSTIMRQVAIIVLMAQTGGFVPAKEAKIGVVDRIFTRVGASDNIMRGQSTFMVEMQEAASILKDATEKSLIIIDEIGRGTSTFDGVAIAWSVAEFIHDKVKAKTLFATHYHELTDIVLTKKGAKNFNIAVKEWNDQIIFLHKLVQGGVNHSYGIQVAQLAGLPESVIERAREVLSNLETGELDEVGQPTLAYSKGEKRKKAEKDINQLQLFHKDADSKIIQELKNLNLEVTTPIEALNILHKLKSDM